MNWIGSVLPRERGFFMSKQEKSRKPLIIGIVAAVVILAALLGLLLTQCVGGGEATQSTPAQTVANLGEAEHYDLYWNLDRALYDGKSEAGMSSRKPESDGFFHVRFFKDGEIIELKVADRKTVNAIEVNDLMGLEFDSNGIIVDIISLDDMPLQQVGWKFYVQSIGGNLLKLNSAKTFDGMELLCEMLDDTGLYDMTGAEGEVGKRITPIPTDRVIAIANLAGELTHVFIYERSEYMQTEEGECQHCKETVTWKLWNKTDTLPKDTGHYRLTNDIVLKTQCGIVEDGKVCLDLNGKVVDGPSNVRMYSLHNVGANLALMDTSEEQTGVMRGHTTSSPQGGIIWVRYGAFYMYGGTLDGSDMVSRLNGTVVQVPKGCYFYMYGGTIIGGTSKYTYDAETKKYGNGLGGALAVSGKFVMHDGEIRDGRAEAAVSAWNADGTPKTYQRGIGGNVYVGSGAEFEMKGGTIKNGVADHSGGNVYLDGTATMTMDGGTIAGGTVTGKGRNGGNVFVTSKATFTLNGGSINWGVSHNCAGNLYFNGTVNMNGGYIGCGVIRDWATGKVKPTDSRTNVFQVGGSMTMFGGVIDGGYTVTDTSATDKTYTTLILGGMPVISGREELEYDDLVLTNGGSGVNVIVATMIPGSKIGVYATTGIFTKPTAEANKQYFYSNIDEANVEYVDGCLALGRWSCLCGSQEHFGKCDGTQLFWAPIPAPVNKTLPGAEGNYYLVKDITISTQGQVAENAHVNLDLYGHTLTGPNNHRTVGTFNPGSSLAITDTSEAKTGTIKTRGAGPTQGSAVWVRYGTFDLYGGTLDGSDYTLYANWNYGTDKIYGTKDDKTEARDGGTVSMSTGTTFNMYGGTIIGTKAILHTDSKTVTEGEGENAVKKTVTRELIAANGGALSISKNAVFNMYDGVIRDGHTDGKGGNIYMAGDGSTANLYGGVIENGDAGMRDENDSLVTYVGTDGKSKTKSAGWGANIDMNNKATVNLLGTIVMGGRSGGNGGNIRVGDAKATLNMSAGMVCDGQSTNDQGGNIFISGTANLTGGVVENGQARNGGNIGVNSSKVATLNGTVVRGGVASGNGGNIRMSSTNKGGALVIAEGAVITGGKAYRGGNLCVEVNNANKNDPESVLKITGGTIEKGLADGEFGGNIYMGSGAVMEMTGGLVDGGKAVNTGSGSYGGNLYNNGATVTISGGALQNGQSGVMAEDGQTVIFGSNDSTKKGWGGNISMKAGTLTISGDAQILGGKAGRNGGSIHAEGGTLNVAGGTISGGVSTADQGGNIWVGGSKTYLNVTGGTIKDGTTAKNGGNIHCNADVNVSLTGGYITGGSAYGSKTYRNANVNLYASENITIGSVKIDGYVLIASSVKLVDKPVIKGGTTNLSVNGFDVDVTGLDVGSDVHMIGVTDSGAGIFSGEADKGEEAYFFSDDAEKVVGFVNGKLTLDKGRLGMGRYRCLCGKAPGYEGEHDPGCDEDTTRFWAAWTSTNSLPTEHGNWYLTASQIKFTSQFVMEEGAEIAIDLNGCVVTDSDNRMLSTSSANKSGNVTLWITDTSAGRAGKLVVTDANYADKGELLWLDTNSTLNLLAGTLDATAVGKATNGAAILVGGKSTLNIYGGSILGGYADVGGTVSVAANSTLNVYGGTIAGGNSPKGGAIYTNGTVNLQSGSILGGTATEGGAIYVDASGSVNLTGKDASISGGVAELGGNLYVLGSLTMTNGEIADGKAVRATGGEGGNIRLAGTASVTLSGGTISGGKAGRLAADGVTMDYGTNNDTKAGLGGNICMADTPNMTVSGDALITGGTCGRNGGNVYIGSGTVTMTGGQVTLGTAVVDQGGNFFNSGDLTITGGTVSGGNAANGGNIGINSNKRTVLGGDAIIKDGVAAGQGGNIRMNSTMTTKCELTIEGNAQITGGHAANGGNICLNLVNDKSVGSMVMTGGTVSGGVVGANGYGGNIYGNTRSVITITGGTVSNGTAGAPATATEAAKSGWGGNIYFKGTLELGGTAAITGGWANNNGGSIHVDGTMTMTGGSITGGFTRDRGGNIFVAKAKTLSVTGGTITGGTAGGTITGGKSEANKGGGNISTNEAAIVSLSNVTIDDPHVDNRQLYRANMEINKNVQLTIGDGTVISGGVGCTSTGVVLNISGKVIIDGGEGCTSNLSLNGNTIILGEMKADSHIGITADEGPFTVANANAETYKAYFTSDNADYSVGAVDNCLVLGKTYCLCGDADGHEDTSATTGCNGEVLFWQPWTSTTSLPKTSGNYYLTSETINFTSQFAFAKNAQIAIDLNGCVVTDTDNRMLTSASANSSGNVTLWITDTAEGGKLVVTDGSYKDKAVVLWLDTNSTLNLIAGTLDAQAVNATTGGAILVAGNSTLKMYGGKIIGGGANTGGAVQVNGGSTFEMYGGIIEGGKAATSGDALYVDGNIKLFGGTINGEVDATKADSITVSGNIKLDAAETNLNLGENTLTVGELTSGASIGITADEGAFTAAGCTEADLAYFSSDIADMGVTYYNGQLHMGKLACLCGSPSANAADHKHYMDGDTLVGCDGTKVAWTPWTSTTTLPTQTGNFYLTAPVTLGAQASLAKNANVALDLNGYKVTPAQKDGKDTSMRMISLHNEGSRFTLTDSYVVPAADSADYDANRTGGEIIGSATRSDLGLVVWLRSYDKGTVFVMLGGKLTGGTGSVNNSSGGVVSVSNNATFYMLDGTISNGTAKNGGNVNVDTTGRMVMTGGEIKDGHAPNGSAIRAFGAVELRGGKVEDTVLMLNWNQSTASITLSGDADVEHIYLNKGKSEDDVDLATIVVPSIVIEGELTGTTVTKITTHNSLDHYIATTTVEANAARFTTDYAGKAIHYIDGKLYLGKYNCLCGGNGNTDTANGGTCVGATEGCDSVLRVWTATSSIPTVTGDYYLTKAITVGSSTTRKGGSIALDLNGYDLTMVYKEGNASRLYSTNGAADAYVGFVFTNTSENAASIIVDDSQQKDNRGGDQGRIVWQNSTNAHVLMYNVDIDLTKAQTDFDSNGNREIKHGLAFSMGGGTLGLYNVDIIGATTTNACGAVINIAGDAKVTMHNSTITNHTGDSSIGGVLFNTNNTNAKLLLSGTSYISGCKTNDGKAADIMINSAVNVSLAEGYTGTAGQPMSIVTGVYDTSKKTSSAAAVTDANGWVAVQNDNGTAMTYDQKSLFQAANNQVLGLIDGKLKIFAAGSHVHCVCAGNLGTKANGYVYDLPGTENDHVCEDILYTPISGEIAGSSITEGGNWYLQDDVTVKSSHYQMVGIEINLCLNGHNWNGANDARAISLQTAPDYLSVTTCQADVVDADGFPTNNRIVGNGTNNQGVCLWVRNGDFDLYAGHVDARNAKGSGGAAICIESGRTMNMYSGSVFGGTSKAGTFYGGNMNVMGTLNMYNGKIYNGNASGGGGNLNVKGTFNMYNGLVTGGMVNGEQNHETANISMEATGVLNISGGEITGGIAGKNTSAAAAVHVSGSAKLTNPSNGYYRLMITSGATAGVPRVKLVVGELADDALVRITVLKEGDKPFLGQFAEAADGYTITDSDAKKVSIWWNGGTTISDNYKMALKDNGLWIQAK